jgi:hypothetical protein
VIGQRRVAGCREEAAAQPGSYLLPAGARPAAVPHKRYYHPSIDILHCSSVCAVKIAQKLAQHGLLKFSWPESLIISRKLIAKA